MYCGESYLVVIPDTHLNFCLHAQQCFKNQSSHDVLFAEIIGRYYHRLCQCIPSNYDSSVDKLYSMSTFNSNAFESICSADNKSEAIVDMLIICSASVQDCMIICEVLENLIEDDSHKAVIETLKYGA